MFQTINQQRISNQLLVAVAALLLAVALIVAIQLASTGVPSFQTQVQAPASGPTINDDSPNPREFRGGRPL